MKQISMQCFALPCILRFFEYALICAKVVMFIVHVEVYALAMEGITAFIIEYVPISNCDVSVVDSKVEAKRSKANWYREGSIG